MRRHCPWCREPVRGRSLEQCPHCGRPLVDEAGTELRPVDVRYDLVEANQCARYRSLQLVGAPVVAAIALVMPLLHVTAVAAVPLLTLIHLILVRVVLLHDARDLLGRTRRRFNRWLARFGFLWIGLPGYAMTTAPVAGVVAGTVTFLGLNMALHNYARWSLRRERDRLGLATWERLLLALLAAVTLVAVVVFVTLSILLGWSVAALIGWLSAD